MARTADINSASSQFFVNLVDNDFLNQRDKSDAGFGYCAFGKVIEGMDVVDKIGGVETHAINRFVKDVPVTAVVNKSVRRAE